MFPLELKSTSDGCDFLPGMWVRVIQTLISEGSGPLVVLSELACYSFPLTLTISHSKTNILSDFLYSRHVFSISILWNSYPISPFMIRISQPNQSGNAFLCLLIQRHEKPKVAGWQS